MRAGVAQGGRVSPVLFCLYVNDTHTLRPRRVSAVCGRHGYYGHVPQSIASRRLCEVQSLYTGALATGLEDFHQRLKSTAMLFLKTAGCIQKPRAVMFLGKPIEWFETARYLGVTLEIILPVRRT
jgi:hypothetical protein